MADGGEDFGDEKTSILQKTDDQDDDEQMADRTQPFQPSSSSTPQNGREQAAQHENSGLPSFEEKTPSTPYHRVEQMEMKTSQQEKHPGLPFDETSFSGRNITDEEIENRLKDLRDFNTKILNVDKADKHGILLTEGEKRSQIFEARKYLKANYPNGKPENLILGFFGERRNQIVLKGPKGGLTKVFLDDGSGLTKRFKELGFVKKILGEPAEVLIKKQSVHIRKMQKENKGKRNKEGYQIISEEIKNRDSMEESLYQTKPLDELKEQDSELQSQKEKYEEVMQDDNASPSDKQAAQDGWDEINEEQARLKHHIEERERTLPLSERVKEIFKKYGVTVTSVLLAAGVTIGVVVSTVTNALKATGKALGKGLKDIGAKLGSLLPGLIGSIASFLFKTAGQAIGFLAEHSWLLILAVVAFLFEKNIKKRR